MTIRKTASLTPQRGLILGALIASLAGCSSSGSILGDKVDYKSAKKASTLDVPPDLTQLQADNRYALPGSTGGVATASGYQAQRGAPGAAAAGATAVASSGTDQIRVERAGNQRWLVVKQTPETLWPQLKSFWEESGFTLALELPAAGLMETEWNENRARIPQDFIRSTIGKVFDSLYSSGERDKFRTRIERLPDGSSEIYISHRGAAEVVTGAQKESTMWTTRANDPDLEAQFLAKLMTKLGGKDQVQATGAVAAAIVQPQHATLAGAGAERHLEVDEGFDRAWRRVGLALDRAGFTVEDRDRTQGLYFVRYVDQDAGPVKGMWAKLFSWGSTEREKEAQRYRIAVKAGAGSASNVTVLDSENKPDTSSTAEKILTVLHEQLK